MIKKLVTVLSAVSCISLVLSKEYLIEVEDLKKLDEKITTFLKFPSKDGWDDNLKEIEYFDDCMKQMIQTLNATFEGLTKTYYQKVERFVKHGKPLFIDIDVVEYEVQPQIKVTDEQLNRLYWNRLHCEQDWERLTEMVILKKQVEIILPP
jgi:hypothetical protein